MASGRRVSLISRKQQTSRWGTFTTSGEKQARHQHLSCGIEGFRPTDGRTPAQERQVSWRLELQSSAQKLTQLFPDRPLRAHCTDAGAAKLSGDRSQSLSDAPLTGLAGPVEIPSLRIFVMRVVRLSPSLAAAPFGPPTTQPVSRRGLGMRARAASFSARTKPSCVAGVVSSAVGARISLPF